MPHWLRSSLLVLALWSVPAAADPFTLAAGGEGEPRVAFTFDRAAKPERLVLRTEQASVAGSRLRVVIDRSPRPALDHVFGADECRFPAGGPSRCELVLDGDDAAFARLVQGFKAGLVAHVTVEDAGVMKMDHALSLRGFTRRYGN